MKVGFLVSSVSREAGGLFQSVRGLAKAVGSTNATVRVFGIRDEQSAGDLQDLSKVKGKGQSESRRTLLYLGRLHPKKNILNLIRAWNQTSKTQRGSRDRWILAIAGWDQGGYETELKNIADGASVVFLGSQFGAEKRECYRTCDAFILPSLSEGLPMTVLEAWAHAKPVLMTPECNLPEGFEANAALRIGTTSEEIAAGLRQLVEISADDRAAM